MKHQGNMLTGRNLRAWLIVSREFVVYLTNQCSIFLNMLKLVNNIYKQKSHEIGNVVKKKCRWWFEILEIFSGPLRRGPSIGLSSLELSPYGPAVIFF